jgi:hypothetical protein
LFTIVLDHLCLKSIEMSDTLVTNVSSLLSLQIDSLPIIALKKSIDLFVNQIRIQKPINEKFESIIFLINFIVAKMNLNSLNIEKGVSNFLLKYLNIFKIHISQSINACH